MSPRVWRGTELGDHVCVCVYAKFVCEEGSVQAIAASIRMNGPISSLGISVSLVCDSSHEIAGQVWRKSCL